MKFPFLITALALSLVYAQPQLKSGTELNGPLNGFIKEDKSPYLVTKDISIEQGTVLVVEPGVKFLFAPGTGLYVNGQIIVAGSKDNNVTFAPATIPSKNGDWKGIFIAGDSTSEIQNAVITGAATGIAAANAKLNLQSTEISKTSSRGVYAKNSKININKVAFFDNEGIALHVDSYSDAQIANSAFIDNNVALYNAPLAITNVASTQFEENTYGIVDMGNSLLNFYNTQVIKNIVGASLADVQEKEVIQGIAGNNANFKQNYDSLTKALPPSPQVPGTEDRQVKENDKIGDLLIQKATEEQKKDSEKKWNMIGNVTVDNHYHFVKARTNTIQTPGFGTETSANLLMTLPEGKSIELNTQITADAWNHFSPNAFTLSYTDPYNHLVLGDFNKIESDLYMSSLPIFGIGYTLSLLKNNADQPKFVLDGFFGESRKPYILGERHPYFYKDYIEDGEAQAQRIAYGTSFKWAPFRRFDAKVGFIYADDEIHDPLLRDGGSRSTETSEPLQQSLTVYADGSWLFYPGNMELKGQVALGRADTADVFRARAIHQVFSEAGLTTSSMRKLRQLMTSESKINTLSTQELEEIFGENTTLTRAQMRDSLRTLLQNAKQQKRNYDSDRDEDRVLGLNWGSQNLALGTSFNWNLYRTSISGHLKYVGEDFYSAGSADQLADSRELGGELRQIITDFWTLGFSYQINVENAAKDGKTNLFGLGEGTHWGLFANENSSWYDKHELDNDRTKYIQNWSLDNEFKIKNNIRLKVGYNLEYRTQYRPNQLHGNYILDDGVYKDAWFAARNQSTSEIISDNDTTIVDSVRWANYLGLANEDNLASKFQERIYKNTWHAEVSVNALNSEFRIGGQWSIRTDDSKFHKDNPISGMDLSDKTFAKLGYYFGGADYFEHSYPFSATTKFNHIQNQFTATPRFKNYERDDMSESEITLSDDFEISLLRRFLTLGLTGEFRYMLSEWKDEGRNIDETEMDILGNIGLTINHSKHFSSEWYTGAVMYYRPDNLSDKYKDIYGGVRVSYVF